MPNPTKEKSNKPGKTHQDEKALFLSVVVPLMDEEESLQELYNQILHAVTPIDKPFELIFVDDGSTDGSYGILEELHGHDKRIKVIRFRRNFGKSAALSVGFKEAEGEFVVTMDADLQDDPAEIPGLIAELQNNYDLISGWKQKRNDPISKTIPSRFFNFVTAKMTGIPIHDFNCGLKAYRKEVIKEVDVHGELHRYIPALAHWAGYKVGEKIVQHHPRKYGHTKFGLNRFLRGFLDLLTVLFTTRYIRRPLHLFGLWGILSFLVGVFIDGYLSIEWFMGKTSLSNRPLFLVGILFIIIGIQFVSFGLLGEMITRQERDEEAYSIREILK
ncbi:MAG: glycosyltransferase family 2 protein [Ignavibacteriales bacterium]|nr:glycosyltransferase family 2 protein [Ignavibacteriales bacterium]